MDFIVFMIGLITFVIGIAFIVKRFPRLQSVLLVLVGLMVMFVGLIVMPQDELTQVKPVENDEVRELTTAEIIRESTDEEILNLRNTDGEYDVVLKKNSLVKGKTRPQLFIDTRDILEHIKDQEDIEYLSIEWKGTLVDQYGNTEDELIMRLGYTKETLDRINWDNFNKDNIGNIADDYWEHEAVN